MLKFTKISLRMTFHTFFHEVSLFFMRTVTALILVLIPSLLYAEFETMFILSPIPLHRIGLKGAYFTEETMRSKKELYEIDAYAEYKFHSAFSAYAAIPYTESRIRDTPAKEHFNDVQLGFKFLKQIDRFSFLGGGRIYFPTGKEEYEIGTQKHYQIEPNLCTIFRYQSLVLSAMIHWKSDLSRNRSEIFEDRSLRHTWTFEGALSYFQNRFQFLIEFKRIFRYQTEENRLSTSVIAPGIFIRFHLSNLGFSFPINIGRGFEPGGTVAHPQPSFRDGDFERAVLIKMILYY